MTGGDKGRFMMARWTGKWMQVSLDERERAAWGGFLVVLILLLANGNPASLAVGGGHVGIV